MSLFRFALLVCAFIIVAALAPEANALEYTPLSKDFIEKLQSDFSKGKSPKLEDLAQGKNWNCQLYGVRSRKQSSNKPKFYSFRPTNSNNLANSGSQIVQTYRKESNQLSGNIGSLKDNLRKSPDSNQLIGEISIPTRELSKDIEPLPSIALPKHTVIAFTICSN